MRIPCLPRGYQTVSDIPRPGMVLATRQDEIDESKNDFDRFDSSEKSFLQTNQYSLFTPLGLASLAAYLAEIVYKDYILRIAKVGTHADYSGWNL
ncbi:MAG: hypothetical protein KGS72_19655 [Cyanobacteria bacterium REEB67]|nr:hypothetical protein [Cyanobacteria bacterium REEB67]